MNVLAEMQQAAHVRAISVGRRPSSEASIRSKVRDLCRYIEEHAAENPSLGVLGARAGLSVYYLQRRFKAIVGITPMQYVEACRLKSLKRALRSGSKVVDAMYDAGFGSSSRLYERVDSRLGMTPTQYRKGGKNLPISYTMIESSFGPLMIAATDRGVCFVRFGSRATAEAELSNEFPEATRAPMSASNARPLRQWAEALRRHLDGNAPHLELPLDIRGTAFQMKVWSFLQSIPRGEVRSYADVAAAIGTPRATRAVGTACSKNPVALLVPCHRVIRGDGAFGDYRWGARRKRRLLRAEGVELGDRPGARTS
jgi:AraC family transcriptional regulator of adaptative response/methylated-DNA-[protein]-cysteine methyltransferase